MITTCCIVFLFHFSLDPTQKLPFFSRFFLLFLSLCEFFFTKRKLFFIFSPLFFTSKKQKSLRCVVSFIIFQKHTAQWNELCTRGKSKKVFLSALYLFYLPKRYRLWRNEHKSVLPFMFRLLLVFPSYFASLCFYQ